jgi:hypothetical protein
VNVENARGGLAALNVALTAGLVFLGYYTFLRHHEPALGDRVPGYLPTQNKVEVNQKSADPLKDYAVVWTSLDKPADPPPPPKQVEKPVVPDDLSAKFSLALVAIDPEDEKLNNCIIQKKDNPGAPDAQQAFRVGETLFPPFDAFRVIKVEATGPKEKRVAIVTLEDTKKTLPSGKHPVSTISLTASSD